MWIKIGSTEGIVGVQEDVSRMVEDVHLECDGLQANKDSNSKLLEASNWLMVGSERAGAYYGHLADSHMQLEKFLSSSDFHFVDGVARLVNGKNVAHLARPTIVFA